MIPVAPAHGVHDFETFSSAGAIFDEERQRWKGPPGAPKNQRGLFVVNAAAYSEHPSTEVLTYSYRLPGQATRRWRPGFVPPQDLFNYLTRGGILESHNAMFERSIWENVCVPKYGWPSLTPFQYQLRCSMATAHVNSLPGALKLLSTVLELPTPKDADGKRLLDKFSVPRNPTKKDPRLRIRPEDDPEDFEKLCAYCDTDLIAESGASERMYPMSADELFFWWIDQEINWRGVGIDRPAVRDCIAVLRQAHARYGDEFRAITGGLDPTQLQAFRGWLAAQGVHVTGMDEEMRGELLKHAALQEPGPVRRTVEILNLIGSASVKKLYAMENQACNDDTLRNLIVHHGARTGRPTGEGPQPLNLPKAGPDLKWCGMKPNGSWADAGCRRPFAPTHKACPWCFGPPPPTVVKWSPPAVDFVLEVMAQRSLDLIEWFFGDALKCISGCVRGLFVARPGMDLIASDYSAIEAVVIAVLAGEQWRIDAFERNEPIYLVSAAKITGKTLDFYLDYKARTKEHHPDRQKIGKVAELACFTPETQVLTNRGYVAIVDVLSTDLLWDGVEWVSHRGVISKGQERVLCLDGVGMTPLHKIICGGSWKEARQLASRRSMLSQALASGSAKLPSWVVKKIAPSSFPALAGAPIDTVLRCSTFLKEKARAVTNAPRRSRLYIGRIFTPMRTLFRIPNIVGDYSIEYLHVLLVAVLGINLKIASTMALAESACFPGGSMEKPVAAPSWPIWSRWRAGMTRPLNWIASIPTAITRRGTSASLAEKPMPETSDPSSRCKSESMILRPVYDIAHAGPRNRFTIKSNSGHLLVHNCGFGGWVGAWNAFDDTGLYTENDIKELIKAWRRESPAIVEMWGGQYRGAPWDPSRRPELYGVEGMAISALQFPGQVFDFRGIKFQVRDGHLFIRLLSGRELIYRDARLATSDRRADEQVIIYWTWNSNPKYGGVGWVPMSTFGGRLTENIVQATAHDILRHAIIRLREAGYPTVLHVYDEILAEVPEGTGSLEQFEAIMSTMPDWAKDWPIRAAGGWRGRRYRKEG